MNPTELAAISDPVLRGKEARDYISKLDDARSQAHEIRKDTIRELCASGLTQREVADLVGVSNGFVAQIVTPPPPKETP